MHERPGVYSSYDASTVVSAGRAAKVIGVAAKAVKGTAGEVVTLTGYAAGVAAFGEDAADTPGMSTIPAAADLPMVPPLWRRSGWRRPAR